MDPDPGKFAPTRWTLVVQARGSDPAAREALSDLCATYYAPIVAFLRSHGRDEDAARERAHAFFEHVLRGSSLEGADPLRGRFRAYLLGAVKHFLADEHGRACADKRGGGIAPISLETSASAPIAESSAAEHAFDRQWALTVMARALEATESELRDAGKSAHFDVLKPWLTGESPTRSTAGAGAELRMSEGAIKVAVHRLRQRFREHIKNEIAQTVPSGADIDDELRHLIAVLVAGPR